MDADGYPEQHELDKISNWSHRDGYRPLMEYVEERWQYADQGYWTVKNDNGELIYKIATAGWSGNEDIIGALKENAVFWALCWWRSERGGGYEFRIRKSM